MPAVDDAVECWCCGGTFGAEQMVRLGCHPEVALCVGCAHWAQLQAREIEDRGRRGVAVRARGTVRRARRVVVDRGWHRSRVAGPLLQRLGRHLP